jgi:hypothetical protein
MVQHKCKLIDVIFDNPHLLSRNEYFAQMKSLQNSPGLPVADRFIKHIDSITNAPSLEERNANIKEAKRIIDQMQGDIKAAYERQLQSVLPAEDRQPPLQQEPAKKRPRIEEGIIQQQLPVLPEQDIIRQ